MDDLRILSALYNMEYKALVLVCVFMVLLLVVLTYHLAKMVEENRRRRENEIFLRNSVKYREIKHINRDTNFHELSPAYHHYINCDSRKHYDRFNPYDWLIEQIVSEDNEMELLLQQAEENRKNYDAYLKKIDGLTPTPQKIVESSGMKAARFYRIEENRCKRMELHPVVTLLVVAHVRYVSPQGRNRYSYEIPFDEDTIRDAMLDAERRRQALEYKKSFDYQKQVQRTRMTASLRYDIMKRDGFRCSLCGASSYTGAELEVDHIVPVSRGGLTEKGNLRTLCKACNRGKGAKFDPAGLN